MIEAQNISKQFDGFWALENVSCRIERGSIYGMVGSNGAGKSTFLRILSGIYRPNSGTVSLDGAPLYENPAAKAKIAFVPDALYFPAGATVARMMAMYRNFHASFDRAVRGALQRTESGSAKTYSNLFQGHEAPMRNAACSLHRPGIYSL